MLTVVIRKHLPVHRLRLLPTQDHLLPLHQVQIPVLVHPLVQVLLAHILKGLAIFKFRHRFYDEMNMVFSDVCISLFAHNCQVYFNTFNLVEITLVLNLHLLNEVIH